MLAESASAVLVSCSGDEQFYHNARLERVQRLLKQIVELLELPPNPVSSRLVCLHGWAEPLVRSFGRSSTLVTSPSTSLRCHFRSNP